MSSTPTHPTDAHTPPPPTTTTPSSDPCPPTPNNSVHAPSKDASPSRGRLKRRRLSSHTPPRAPSPSRGHDRDSGSRHRQHYRKHQRASSSSPFAETPPSAKKKKKKNRRRSDAEPDHTFRGRVRKRSESGSGSAIEEGEEKEGRTERKRSVPPSRGREEGGALRRLRSYPHLYRQGDERVLADGE